VRLDDLESATSITHLLTVRLFVKRGFTGEARISMLRFVVDHLCCSSSISCLFQWCALCIVQSSILVCRDVVVVAFSG